MDEPDRGGPALAILKRFLTRKAPPIGEACDLCGVPIAERHAHVVALEARRLLCSCRACFLLFTHEGAAGGKYRAVPERYRRLSDARVSEAQWDALQVPVGIAFFFTNSALGRTVGFYPSPAGATESELPLDTWAAIVAANPELATLEPDVEALLVQRRPDGTLEAHLAPIDACYELVGIIRRHWKGFDGGTEARDRIAAFFVSLGDRCADGRAESGWAS
jgi:hypothetical protein